MKLRRTGPAEVTETCHDTQNWKFFKVWQLKNFQNEPIHITLAVKRQIYHNNFDKWHVLWPNYCRSDICFMPCSRGILSARCADVSPPDQPCLTAVKTAPPRVSAQGPVDPVAHNHVPPPQPAMDSRLPTRCHHSGHVRRTSGEQPRVIHSSKMDYAQLLLPSENHPDPKMITPFCKNCAPPPRGS